VTARGGCQFAGTGTSRRSGNASSSSSSSGTTSTSSQEPSSSKPSQLSSLPSGSVASHDSSGTPLFEARVVEEQERARAANGTFQLVSLRGPGEEAAETIAAELGPAHVLARLAPAHWGIILPGSAADEGEALVARLARVLGPGAKLRQLGFPRDGTSAPTLIESLLDDGAMREPVGDEIAPRSRAMQRLHQEMLHVARSTLSVLILGETGVGKDVLAQRIHAQPQRAAAPFYAVNRRVLAAILCLRRGPSTVEAETLDERLSLITEELVPDSAEGRNRRLRFALTRRLLDDPVLYYHELTPDELSYLHAQRGFLLKQIEEATGLIAEVRKEGLALVDEDGELTDLGMPEEGTDGHFTLLLAEELAERARRAPDAPVPSAALEAHAGRLLAEHRGRWRRSVTERELMGGALARLEALRLVTLSPEGVIPLPAIARYALREPRNA
jgi:hypothetical protein